MSGPTVTLKALHEYEADLDTPEDEDSQRATWAEWCDPLNIIVHWSCSMPSDWENHDSGEPKLVTMPLREAARFVGDFPGGVWDYSEGEFGMLKLGNPTVYGMDRLFVEGDNDVVSAVFRLAAAYEARRDARWKARYTR